jgi:hypothetical protein
MTKKVVRSFNALEKYCNKEDYKGWDPYDGLSSKVFNFLPVLDKNRLGKLLWIQLMKKLPVNLRPILLVEKGYNPKGLSLFISGYCKISQIENKRSESMKQIDHLCKKVLSLKTEGFSGNCWGYNFDWQSRAFFQKKYTPTIVVTSFVANSLLDAFEVTRNEEYLHSAISSKDFLLNDLKRTYNDKNNFAFSYSPYDTTSVFNASLLGARLLSRIYTYTKEEALISTAKKAVAFCCDYQNKDGSWYYSNLPFHHWIDNFHTGFNLECIYEYGLFSKDSTFENNYNNSLYPIDIHASSQFFVTLSKTNLFHQYRKKIDEVAKWTINNMQSTKGYFYFQKRKCYTNKIPYMRWSQGWIFYGLSHYLHNTCESNHSIVTEANHN